MRSRSSIVKQEDFKKSINKLLNNNSQHNQTRLCRVKNEPRELNSLPNQFTSSGADQKFVNWGMVVDLEKKLFKKKSPMAKKKLKMDHDETKHIEQLDQVDLKSTMVDTY
ncbi:hypothetical protein CU098_008957 [Rhizopus stolonifer]|uniref:Uncharacterized protein n=1 Tax=Rhizopus stolonifer TaxID=4846 RepID=A0A367K1Y3_RHIST|nr:hypothetical protein CU098_008957 [Rhizopus stolonifer]